MAKTLYVDNELLDCKIKESGLRVGHICDILAISRQGFDKKRKGITSFRASEVYVLCDLLNINGEDKAKIFKPKVN